MKTTKNDVDKVYCKPINPEKPFERLTTLMQWAISELQQTKEDALRHEAAIIHKALSTFYSALLEGDRMDDKRLYDAIDIVLDDLFEKMIPEMKDDPLYIPKITIP